MKQKFEKMTKVIVRKEAFPFALEGFDAIVRCSYGQAFDSDDTSSYEVYRLDDGVPVSRVGWLAEAHMTAHPEQDRHAQSRLVKEYHERPEKDR